MGINYLDLEPGNAFWNWVSVPSYCYKSVACIIASLYLFCLKQSCRLIQRYHCRLFSQTADILYQRAGVMVGPMSQYNNYFDL